MFFVNARSVATAITAIVIVIAAGFALLEGSFGPGTQTTTSSSSQGTSAIITSSLTSASTHIISFATTDTTVDLSVSCHSVNGLPDPQCTPGAIDPNVTQGNVNSTICVSGYTATVRPSTSYTTPLKIKSIQQYGYQDTNTSDYEYDHLISLELGGDPKDTRNLWAEPHYGNFTSLDKDGFENFLHSQACGGLISLAQAQMEISTNWVQYWIAAGKP